MNKSSKIFFFWLFFLAGIFISNYFLINSHFIYVLCVFVPIALLIIRQKMMAVLLFALIIGIWRLQIDIPTINTGHIAYYIDQKITFEAIISEVDTRSDHVKLTAETEFIIINKQISNVRGKILIKNSLYPKYNYGDKIQVECKIVKPEPIENFRYDRYLARYNIYATCYQPRIQVIATNQGNYVLAAILNFKKKIENIINKTIPEPQAAFLSGILLGTRTGIPQNLLYKFNTTGITHIIAISGYNITIIATILMNLTLALYIPRKKAFWLILITIIAFTILAGMSAAVVRASIMGMLVLYVKYLGRKSSTTNILIYSATLMCLINPKILRDDAGFQLSFMATIGLIYFEPIVSKYFQWVTPKFGIQENFVCTISAIILTTPLILYQFGRLSIVAPIVNLLILSIIPPIMLVGFIQVIFGAISISLGQAIGHISWLMMEYIIQIVNVFSSWIWASINIHFNVYLMLSSYLLIFYLIKKKKYVQTQENLIH